MIKWRRVLCIVCLILGHDWIEGNWRGKRANGVVIAAGTMELCTRCNKTICRKEGDRNG